MFGSESDLKMDVQNFGIFNSKTWDPKLPIFWRFYDDIAT